MEIQVCVSCRGRDDAEARPGAALVAALETRLAERGESGLSVVGVECLAVCKRPATLAFAGPRRWTYVVGDLDAATHLDDVIDAARAYEASENGIVPWKERPACFRTGVVARTPPLKG